MSEEIFRKKSLEKVKSPENLDDYIKVSNPGIWLLLISVIVLLAGACVWAIFGHIDSTLETSIHVKDGGAVCYVAQDDVSSVKEGMTVKFNDFEAVITEVGQKGAEGYACVLKSAQTIPDGFYNGEIETNSIKPISFVLN